MVWQQNQEYRNECTCVCLSVTAMQEDMEELEVEEDEDDVSTVPLRDDATYCFNRHSGTCKLVSFPDPSHGEEECAHAASIAG